MSIGNTKFHPSVVEDRIYDLMTKEVNIAGSDSYTGHLLTDVSAMMVKEFPQCEWECFINDWNDKTGATTSFAWIEDGHLHLIGWDIKAMTFQELEAHINKYYKEEE